MLSEKRGLQLNDKVKTCELFECHIPHLAKLFENSVYPWEMLPKIKELAAELVSDGLDGYTLLKDGVLVGENVKIYPGATIEGPAVIGDGTEIRPGAFIRGSVIIGRGCVIGNSTELKNCILLDEVQAPHYNYIGDSILGNRAHTGAGVICSNLKNDKQGVVVRGNVNYPTGLRKVGAIIGDGADIGCNSVINPGTVIGKGCAVYPLTFLRGVYPPEHIIKNNGEVVKKK